MKYARINVQGGRIEELKIYGDFLGLGDVREIESCLLGVRYEPHELSKALEPIEVSEYFGVLTRAEFVELLY
ncbi:MAG: lipoate protein ligase C-terminal domain-containing protein [Planctomycetota bacterium]